MPTRRGPRLAARPGLAFRRRRPAPGRIGELDRYLARYAQLTGIEVTREELLVWEVFGNVKWATGCLTQSRRTSTARSARSSSRLLGRLAAEMEYELLDLIEHAA